MDMAVVTLYTPGQPTLIGIGQPSPQAYLVYIFHIQVQYPIFFALPPPRIIYGY